MPSRPQRQPGSGTPLGLGAILIVLIVLIALGCAPMSKQSNGYAYDGDMAGSYDGKDDYAEGPGGGAGMAGGAQAYEVTVTTESKAKFRAPARSERSRGPASPAPRPDAAALGDVSASTGSTTTVNLEPEPKPAEELEPLEPGASSGRQIIYTAGLGVSVFDVADTMAKLEAIPERYGGWLHQRYDDSVILRVPAAQLQTIINEISTWGVLEWKTLEALDVTAAYTDLESRIRVLEQMHQHLSALLAKAENVEQALEIQVELSRISAELEQLRAQMRMLASSIEFSTLAVELHQRGASEPEPGYDPFPWVDELGAEATGFGDAP